MRTPSRYLTFSVLLMVAVGFGVNRWLAAKEGGLTDASASLSATQPVLSMPGTIYVSENGTIYKIAGGSISALPLPRTGSWIQPHLLPDGSLLAVQRFDAYSDIYHVSADGAVLGRLTDDANTTLQQNHWAMWPAVASDGSVLYSTDSPKPPPNAGYEVDFAVWSMAMDGGQAAQWSTPDPYTGGDIEPAALPDGSVLYASYAITAQGSVYSTLGIQGGPLTKMTSLTTPAQDCGSPAVASDGVTVAMICTANKQTTSLEVATLSGTTLSPPRVVVANCLCNSPSWSSRGNNLLYLDSQSKSGNFSLWSINNASSVHPAPQQVTDSSVDLDATSAAAWAN
jgi:hypothetical protein